MNSPGENVSFPELVRQAQLGKQQSIDRLSELAAGALRAYIYRLTLNFDMTEDLSQDTLLEMVKSLKNRRQFNDLMKYILEMRKR